MEYKGNPVSQGFAVGRTYLYNQVSLSLTEKRIKKEETAQAILRYETAKASAKAEIELILSGLDEKEDDKAKIISTQINLIYDKAIDEEVREHITEDLWDADWAILKTYSKYIKIMERSKDPIFRERSADLKDVLKRLLMCNMGIKKNSLNNLPEPCIVICHDLLPSDCINIDQKNILAIVTEVGGETSHSAIIARSYQIPAVLGVSGIFDRLRDGQMIIVDAVRGIVFENPDENLINEYERKTTEYKKTLAEQNEFKKLDPKTADGEKIEIMLNISSMVPTMLEDAKYVDGVGLMRTEFLYMESDHMPTEEEQYAAYKSVLTAFRDRPVTLRTLDIGGDKTLSYFEMAKEANPFLGERAVRLCFNNPGIFKTQLRAALRASVFGNLWLIFPMISSIDEIRLARNILENTKAELLAEGLPYSENVKIGIMIEIPSAAVISDMIVKEVDFASIGTNDLVQYTLAVDRMNPRILKYYQVYNPAVLRLIKIAAEEFNKAGKPLSVCGEMAGDPLASIVLIGLGIKKLSMNLSSVAAVKKMITGVSLVKAREIASAVCRMPTASDIESFIRKELYNNQHND